MSIKSHRISVITFQASSSDFEFEISKENATAGIVFETVWVEYCLGTVSNRLSI